MVRFANSLEDKNEALKMWSQCFTDSSSYVDYYFSKRYENSNFLLNEKDGKVLGGLHLNPYTFNFYGNSEQSFYIVGVGVYPEYRGQGVYRELMNAAAEIAQERGMREIFLHPINREIYIGLGYTFTHYINEYRVDLDKFSFDSNQSVIEHLGLSSKIQITEITISSLNLAGEELINFINRNSLNYSSSLIKNFDEFKRYLDELNFENGHFYKLEMENRIVGTFSYTPEDKNLIIKDLIFNSSKELEVIFNFLKKFGDYYEKVIFRTSLDLGLELFIKNPEKIEKVEIPFMMTKVIDKERVLNEFFEKAELDDWDEFEIIISARSEELYDNFKWKNNSGKLIKSSDNLEKQKKREERLGLDLEFEKLTLEERELREKGEEIKRVNQICTDWDTLTKIIYGALDFEVAKKMGLLAVSNASPIYQKLKKLKIKRGFILEYV